MTLTLTPSIDLEGFDHLVFTYDHDDDIAYIHIDGPRAAITERIDDGWYLRLDGGAIVGMELHGLRRIFLSTAFYAAVFEPAIRELEALAGSTFDEGLHADRPIDKLPRTTRLVIFLIGQAVTKFETLRRAEAEDAGRALLAVS
ncbi:MAG: DUF2283 domain-containing protein [Tepidiformaceae bacterium]